MFRYLAVCLSAIYTVLLVYGDETRRPDVTRQAQDDVTGFSLASFALPEASTVAAAGASGVSDDDAIRIALAAGQILRADRGSAPLRGRIPAIGDEAAPVAETAASASQAQGLWHVIGERVNLRAGPGTGNAVVGQMVLGDMAEVLDNRDGWYQVRAADGTVAGWIFGKFLSETQPG